MASSKPQYHPGVKAHVQTTQRVQTKEVLERTIEKIGPHVSLARTQDSAANKLGGRHSWSEGGRHVEYLTGPDADFLGLDMKGKTVFITGSSRGIGEAIAVRCAKAGANVAIVAKTTAAGTGVFGTIHTAAKAVTEAGGRALAIKTDLTKEEEVRRAVTQTVLEFGGIDILVNNASAIWTKGTEDTDNRHYDYVTRVCQRGAFLATRACLPYLQRAANPHVLSVAPAPMADGDWLRPHVMYSTSKIGMGFLAFALQREFHGTGVAFNTIWPYYTTATAAVNMLGGEDLVDCSMSVAHMADPAYRIMCTPSHAFQGNFCLDVNVLASLGVTSRADAAVYQVVPEFMGEIPKDFMVESTVQLPWYSDLSHEGAEGEGRTWPGATDASSLQGKRVLVTGAGYGIGRAVALAAAAAGAKVALVGGRPPWMPRAARGNTLEDIAAAARDAGAPTALAIDADIVSTAQVVAAVAEAATAMGGLDAVVLAAHSAAVCGTLQTSEDVYDRMMDYTVRSGFVTVRESIPHLRASPNPHVLWLAPPPVADAGWFAAHPAYSMACCNRGMYSHGMAGEFGPEGIAVNSIWPAVVPAGASEEVFKGKKQDGEAAGLAAPEARCRRPEAVGNAAVLVLSRPAKEFTDHFLTEESVLRAEHGGGFDLAQFSAAPAGEEGEAPPAPHVFSTRLTTHKGTVIGDDGVPTVETDATLPAYGGPNLTFPSRTEFDVLQAMRAGALVRPGGLEAAQHDHPAAAGHRPALEPAAGEVVPVQ